MVIVLGERHLPAVVLFSLLLFMGLLQLVAFLVFKLRTLRAARAPEPASPASGAARPALARPTLCGPWQIWVDNLLTRFPCLALLFGLALPVGFSLAGLYASNFSVEVNLDFSTYLTAELEEQYLLDLTNGLARAQVTRVENLQERGEERWRGWNFLTAETNTSDLASAPARELLSQYATYWKLDLFYQAKDEEKGIFTPEALEEIRDFERRLRALEGYGDFCRKRYSFVSCDPAYTVTNIFFSVPNASSISGDTMQVIYDGSGSLANIEDVLKGFLRDGIDWWVDKDFGPKNLKSLYTRASFFGGLPLEGYESLDTRLEEQKAKSNDFLRKVWTDLLHRTDLPGDEGLHYEHVVFTWAESRVLYGHEVNFYLFNDLRFCIGTFILVSALILLRQQSLVTTFCGILGVPLAFSATYYFHYVVMGYQRMSVMDFVSIFLIVGIAADDILLLYNTYQLASAVVQLKGKTNQPAARMRWAYREAASAMLVTSVTTCVSFYANMLSIVSVVRQFGFFMGTLVLWNFLNVLTIFPASLLVNEMYLAPLWCCCRATKGPAPSSASCGEAEAVEMVQTASRLARQFSKDHDSHYVLHMQTEIQHDHLDCTERFMDRRFRPFLVTFRWLLLAFSFSLSGLCVFLAYTGFSLASGDIVIFEEDVNLGRVAALTSEIFPSYTSADLNNNLAILNPLQPQIKPSCPRLGDNNSWCSGLGSCDTFTGRCTCQEGYVGQACSVLRADPTLDFVPWPPPSIPKSYDYIHILARPSLLESPGTADATEPIYFLNQGDEPVEWSIEAPPESSSWLGLLQSSGAVPPRVFSRTDDAFPGRGGLMARYFVANRAAGFSEVVNLNLTSDLGTDTVRFSALVLQPPALSSLEVELLDLLDDVNVTPTLVPPFALDYGFSEVDGLNLARPGNTPLPSYRLDLPYAVPSIALSATLYSTAERAEYPPAVQLETEPAVNRIFLRVFSAFSADVSVVYTLEVVRASTTSTTTTSITTTFVARSIVSGELSIIVSDCMALSTDEVARRDLERGLGASLALPARQVEITDVRCTGTVRMEGSQRRVQSQAELVYEISLGGDANVSEVVTRIEQQTTASLTQELQSALDAGSSNLQLAVTSIGPVDQREGVTSTVTRTMTGTSTSRSSSSTTASFTSTSFTATSSMTLTVTQTTSTSTSRSTSSSTQSTSSSSTSTSSLTTTGGSTSSSSSSSSSRSFTSHTTSSTTSSTATFSSSTSSTVSTTGSLSSSTRTSSTRTTQTSTSGTETSQTSSTKTSSSLSSSSLSSTTSSISTSTISSSSTSTISITTTSRTTSSETSSSTSTRSTTSTSSTATTSSSSITHSSSTATTTSTGPDYIISGSISIELSNWTDEAVEEGLRNGIAEVAGVDPSWVRVTLPEPGEERRLSSSPMTVDYTIDLPPSLDMAAVAKVRTQIREEPLSSFGETLSDALDLAGAEVVLVLRAVETPWIEVKTTPPPSTTSTTLFCPGEPVCGGLHGVCEATEEPSKPWQCSCSETYAGPSCAERVCPSCENNGTCSNESQDASGGNWACDCPAGFQGDRCELLRCPNDCSESGDCDTDTGVCSCFSGYSAVDCSLTPDWKVPLLNCIDIILTWGLKGHELDNASAPEFDPRFELLAAPETQAWLLETCQLARADLELLVRDELPCWIEGFETFVNAVGGMFPVEDPDLASQALQAFMHQDLAKKFYGDVVTDGVDYGGRLYFTMVRLKINVAQNANTTYRSAMRERWNDWVRRRNEGAPFRAGAMLMVSATWTQMQLESEVVQSTLLAFSASISVSLLAVAVFSQLCRSSGAGPPPPGVFRLLGVALSAAGEDRGQSEERADAADLPLGFLEEIATNIDGYEGVVSMEAIEALLAVPPTLVRSKHWLPVFQRALREGLHDPQLARHVLSQLERWRDAGAHLDWSLLLPSLAAYLGPGGASSNRRSTAAERRATRGLAAGPKAEDRRTLLRRVLRFVGSLGGDCHGLVLREPRPEELRRPIHQLGLKLSLSLGGALVELEPSELLPHLARLLAVGGRRQARLAAGESLHALLRHIIGNDSPSPEADGEASTAFAEVLRAPLLPMALRAAADEDATLAELFKSLLKQFVAWMAHRPPTASLSSLRDALLEAMGDAQTPALRYAGAQFFAELLVALHGRQASTAKRLLQYLISAAKHVDRRTQLAALRALRASWCSFGWEPDAELPAVDVMQVVILGLQTSHRDGPSGLPVEALALQLGSRLLEALIQALQAPERGAPTGSPLKRVQVPESLVHQLWRGSGFPECAARGFCRSALRRLQKFLPVTAASSLRAVKEALSSQSSALQWNALSLAGAEKAQETMELLSTRLDTALWLALPDGGQALLEKSTKVPVEKELARRALEEAPLLVPWSPAGGLEPGQLSEALGRLAPREREQLLLARTRGLVALVACARFGEQPSPRQAALLITLLLDPGQLQVGASAWRSSGGRRRVMCSAAQALARMESLPGHLLDWQRRNPHMDPTAATNDPAEAFEAWFQQWPEHKENNALAIAERMSAYVEGLEVLQESGFAQHGFWAILFEKWPGGFAAFLKSWQRSIGRAGRQRSAASQLKAQAFVRLLLVVLPRETPSTEVISSLLCLPRPPPDATTKVLQFLAEHSRAVFETSKTWSASRKRLLLSWLCDFVHIENDRIGEGDEENANGSPREEKGADGRGESREGELGPALQGSVLAGEKGDSEVPNLSQSFSRLLRDLPAWHEWAVSDAAHGGADDEDAPPSAPAKKRRKDAGVTSMAVRRARADRTGLYQLALLLRSCCSVEAVLLMLPSAAELCKFLSDVLQAVLCSDFAPPRTKGLFLEAIPPLLLKAEMLASPDSPGFPALCSAAQSVEHSVREMVTKYFPLNSREYHRSADEYATYLILLEGLFRSLERSAPSMRLLPALHSTLRVHDHREAVRLRDFVRRFVKHLLERHHAAQETLKALLRIFLDQSLDDRLTENIRFAIMEKLALPLLWDLVASPQSCKECWLAHWSLLVQHADPDVSFAQLRMRDVEALNLKVQEMAGIYGMIEVLFVRTAPDQLKEQIMPELQSSPSRDIILIAKRALKKPTGWERVALPSLRRCQLRIYAALSAAIGATQTKQEMYTGWLFEKVLWDETMIEPWEGASGASIALDTLKPESNYNSFPRPGYSFAYLSAAVPGRTPAARARAARGAEESTLLGAGLWAATPATQAPMTQTSLRFAGGLGTLGRAAAAKASQELTLMLPEKQRRQLATASKGTASQVISLVVTGSSDGLTQGEGVPLPPGEEGQALRLQAVLAGRRLSGVAGETDRGATWQTEWLEHDEVIFPDGPTNDCALTLFLVLLRTLDVLTERFGVPSGANHLSGSWLQSLLAIVDKASTDFRLRILLLKVFIHRADVMQPVLYGRNVEIFRFLLSMLLDPRFGAEKRFHYLARDVVSTLLVPKLDSEVQVTLPRDCLMDCQRLLHQLQLTAPHRTTYWQKAHLGILRLFAAQYLRPSQAMPITPDGKTLLRQLTAKNRENALVLQQSGLRQLVIFLEFGGFDPIGGNPADASAWKEALLSCVVAKDLQLAAYACGAIALLAKWHPTGRSILQECCALVEAPPIQARLQDRSDGLRLALCTEQLLLMCPWALSDAPEELEASESTESGPRRKLFARVLQRLATGNLKVLRALLSGLLELCRDCVQPDESVLGTLDVTGRRRPPRPTGDAVRAVRRNRLEELLLTLRASDVWRRGLQSRDASTQLATGRLANMVANRLDDEVLLSCLGLMLEAEATLRENASADSSEQRIAFEKELLSLCIGVCERRPDVARGEVAEGVLGFVVRAAVSDEWRQVKEALTLKLGDVKAQAVQEMADEVKSTARDWWDAQLSGDAAQRVADLCLRLGGKAEHEPSFIPATLSLLLSLARKSADYRQVKNKPLSDIEFRPMQISTSSWASTALPQTFQLGSVWASTYRGTASQTRTLALGGGAARNSDAGGSVAASLAAEALPRELRARKELPPVPSFHAQAKPAGGGAGGTSTAPVAPAGAGTGLLRHTEEDSRRVAIFRKERETKAALASLERREREGVEEDVVDLVSGYREGSYPDVEVSLADILEPLARAATEDLGLAEELLLAVWCGLTAKEVLSGAFNGLLSGCLGDVTLVHFLHSLVVRCSQDYGKTLPLPALQRTLGFSELSGIQALEELLESGLGRSGVARLVAEPGAPEEVGRTRAVLSALYSASSALGEEPSMSAVVAQLRQIKAFSSPHSSVALRALRDGQALTAQTEESLTKVLDQQEVVPSWELQLCSAARVQALEELMSWKKLRLALSKDMSGSIMGAASLTEKSLRAELGLSFLEEDAEAKELLAQRLVAARAEKLDETTTATGCALLALHGVQAQKWDEARRLVYQGYDSFAMTWNRLPLLAASARHERLSALPLLQSLEAFLDAPTEVSAGSATACSATSRCGLSVLHDRFTAWTDHLLLQLGLARQRHDAQGEALAFAQLGQRCRERRNWTAAQDMMRRCLQKRKVQDVRFFDNVLELKLAQKEKPCVDLCAVARRELSKHQEPEACLRYTLILAKIAKAGWERREMSHEAAWDALSSARGLAEKCNALEQSLTYAQLSSFADAVLRREEAEGGLSTSKAAQVSLVESLVTGVLQAIKLGEGLEDPEAFRAGHERLPRLFELLALFPGSSSVFEKHARSVPSWPFLRWLPQALAHLPHVPVLRAPLELLAEQYPQALFWPLQLSSHQDIVGQRQSAFQPLWAALERSQAPVKTAMTFTQALDRLTHPEKSLPSELRSFREALVAQDAKGAKERWRRLWRKHVEVEVQEIAGTVHVDFGQRVKQRMQESSRKLGLQLGAELANGELVANKREAWMKFLQDMQQLPQTKQWANRKAPIEAFSPWLAKFDTRSAFGSHEEQLEVLGQYRGLERPEPRSHASVTRFGPQLLIMASKQMPKRLVILGSDEREHWFLVKGGEDVRLDERVEQLFGIINSMAPDAAGLRVRTYSVIPLFPDLGALEWVRETKPLKAIVQETARAKEMNEIEAHKLRIEWSKRFGGQAVQRYSKIFELPKADAVVAFQRCVAAMPSSASLKAFFWSSAVGPEAFWHTRQRFAASLAAASAACYLLGIGDRHLDNYLLCLRTAELVPIDFGYSFGIGALLPVPELMPFRLTSFLLSALQPLAGPYGHGTFRDSLEQVLSTCRAKSAMLLDACAIFIREPLLDWTTESRRRGFADLDFLPKRRLHFLSLRLQGQHPASILKEELTDNQTPWVKEMARRSTQPLELMVAGLEEPERAKIYQRGEALTAAEQAECLIRQATDPNILGRAWEGWAPEI